MSIPIEFQVYMYRDGEAIDLIELKDGSVYIMRNRGHLEPVSRSYAGMILKDAMRERFTKYVEIRKKYKKARDIPHMFVEADGYKDAADSVLGEYHEFCDAWGKFKSHSTKKVRDIDPSVAEAKRRVAIMENCGKKIAFHPINYYGISDRAKYHSGKK